MPLFPPSSWGKRRKRGEEIRNEDSIGIKTGRSEDTWIPNPESEIK
jgi:hypothetical protein